MTGLVLALLNPLFASLQNVIAKKQLCTEEVDDMAVVFARLFYVVPVLLVYLSFVGLPKEINFWFWPTIAIMILLEVPSQWFLHQAIKTEQISLVMPISTLLVIPLFATFFIFGGWSWLGASGAILSTLGVYSLEVIKSKTTLSDFLTPLKSLVTNQASRHMLYTVLLWSITTPLQKIAVEQAQGNAAFMGVIYLAGCSCLVVVNAAIKHKPIKNIVLPAYTFKLIPIGVLAGLSGIMQYQALKYLNPVYVIALKETILLWSVLWDRLAFNQKVTRQQLVCICLVTLGAIMVGLSLLKGD